MQSFRTFFKKEIFAEGVIPNKTTKKVVIFCDGAPSVPSKRKISEFFNKKGYAFIHIRYRGTWESKGIFLKKSLDQDLLDVIDELSKGWEDLWSREKFKINPKKIVLVGTSFGGPAVLLASRDPRVSKVIVISPVVDWSAPNRDEPLSKFKKFMKEAYGNVYRGKWEKLGKNGFYEPTMDTDGSKVFILHAKDDGVVRIKEVAQFAKKTKSNIKILKIGGHLSTSLIMKTAIWKTISKFLKTTTTISRKS